MVANILILILLVAGVAYFYLKCNIMTSLTNALAALMGCILAFSYYEQLAGLLASEQWAVTWIQSAAFLLIFFFGFLFIRVLSGFLAKSDFEVSRAAKMAITIVCGILTGAVVSGVLLIALVLSPLPPGGMNYSRYRVDQPIYTAISYPPFINVDGFVASFYSWISRGSLSSKKSFSVLHADYLSRIHLNRYALGNEIPAVCSPKAIKLPGGNVQSVRLWNIPDQPQMTVVRLGISGNPIAKGGTAEEGKIALIPAQIRLITKDLDQADNLTGSANIIYPSGVLSNGVFESINLNEEITEEVKNLGPDRTVWLDLAFQIASGQRAILLSFKQNALIELPKAVPTSEEIEKALEVN